MLSEREEAHKSNRTKFAILAFVLQVLIVIIYGIFVRVLPHNDSQKNQQYYPMFQDVNVMMLIGFGFLMTFVKHHAWSALSYTFFINAIVMQLYPLLQGFWHRVFHGHWDQPKIYLSEEIFTASSYSVASMLIAFGAILGKVGPFELLIMGVLGVTGYTLNEDIVYNLLYGLDAGGSMPIHIYGAYFGLMTSFIISRKVRPTKKIESSYYNNTFAMIGTLFLWMFWPSFNAGYFGANGFQKSLIISNTIISLTGSCLATFIMSAMIRDKFSMEDIVNATLAGGVAIGAPSGLVANPGISLTIGLAAGTISTICFSRLGEKLYHAIGLHDTCGIHNLHGIPGLMGGLISAMVVASYQTLPGLDQNYKPYVNFIPHNRSYSGQAGIQVACSFVSLGIGLAFGAITGLVLYCVYDFRDQQFFEDKPYFQVPGNQSINAEQYGYKESDLKNPPHPKKLAPIHGRVHPTYSQVVLDNSMGPANPN